MKLTRTTLIMILAATTTVAGGARATEINAITPPPVTGGGVVVETLSNCGPDTLQNHDGTFENAYTWTNSGVQVPDFGAFAERFSQHFVICEIHLYLTQTGNQAGQTMDVVIWQDDDTGNPGDVIIALNDVDPGPIATWPEISEHVFPVNIEVNGNWWVGWWGNWPAAQAGWLGAVDENGPGGNPRTKIAPDQYLPIGWEHPNIVTAWQSCQSLGIQVVVTSTQVGVDDPLAGGEGGAPVIGPRLTRIAPNPFGRSTHIEYEGAGDRAVSLSIFDVKGRLLRTLVDDTIAHGVHSIAWDGTTAAGRPVPAGIYYVRLGDQSGGDVQRLVVVR